MGVIVGALVGEGKRVGDSVGSVVGIKVGDGMTSVGAGELVLVGELVGVGRGGWSGRQ
jgi:hypothetical protein